MSQTRGSISEPGNRPTDMQGPFAKGQGEAAPGMSTPGEGSPRVGTWVPARIPVNVAT